MRVALGLAPLLLSLAGAASAQATTDAEQPPPPEVTSGQQPPPGGASEEQQAADKDWQFATIGYVWFAGAWGKTDVIGPVQPVDLDLPFGKVLKAFKFAFMGAAEARHDRLVFLGDLTFIHLGTDEGIGIRDPDFLQAELDSRTAEVTALGGYRVLDKGPVAVDLLAGGRMNWFKTRLQLDGPNRSLEGTAKEDWFDPLVAGRIQAPLGGKWGLTIYGDVGGFGVGSHLTWQAVGTVNYQISRKMTLGAGWRHFKIDYSHGDFLYNVYQTGPIISFRTAF